MPLVQIAEDVVSAGEGLEAIVGGTIVHDDDRYAGRVRAEISQRVGSIHLQQGELDQQQSWGLIVKEADRGDQIPGPPGRVTLSCNQLAAISSKLGIAIDDQDAETAFCFAALTEMHRQCGLLGTFPNGGVPVADGC